MRRLAFPLVLALVAGSLASCSPPSRRLVALTVKDGGPVVVMVTCPGDLSQLSVYRDDPDADPRSPEPLESWHIYGDAPRTTVEVPVLGKPPDGWATSGTATLTELKVDERYAISGHGRWDSFPVHFTVADFDRIGSDQVLAAVNLRKAEVMTRDEFLDGAADPCG